MMRIVRSSVLFINVCLVIWGCARNTLSPPTVIFNEAKKVHRIPTLADNMAAYVSVYCFWSGGVDGETMLDIMPGVVLDQIHVLTMRCDDNTTMSGFEEARMEPITIGPFDGNNESGRGLWEAHQVTEDSEDTDFVIISTYEPMSLPSIVLAPKTPELYDLLYTVTSYADDPAIRVVDLFTVSIVDVKDVLSPEGGVESDFSVLVPYTKEPYSQPSPASVFNKYHEFVGFTVGGLAYVIVPNMAPEKFRNGKKPYGIGYDIAGVGRALKPLLLKAGIQQP